MRRPEELIDRFDPSETIAAIDQDAGVAGKCRRITGCGQNRGHGRSRQLLELFAGAGSGWVDQRQIKANQFHLVERPAEQIPSLRGNTATKLGLIRATSQGCQKRAVVLDSMHRRVIGCGKGQGSATREQIDGCSCGF